MHGPGMASSYRATRLTVSGRELKSYVRLRISIPWTPKVVPWGLGTLFQDPLKG